MTPLERAEQAKQLLASPVFRDAMDALREDIVVGLEKMPPEAMDAQHEAALMLKTLVQLRIKLSKFADYLIVEKHKQDEARWYERARESITDLMPPRRAR